MCLQNRDKLEFSQSEKQTVGIDSRGIGFKTKVLEYLASKAKEFEVISYTIKTYCRLQGL